MEGLLFNVDNGWVMSASAFELHPELTGPVIATSKASFEATGTVS